MRTDSLGATSRLAEGQLGEVPCISTHSSIMTAGAVRMATLAQLGLARSAGTFMLTKSAWAALQDPWHVGIHDDGCDKAQAGLMQEGRRLT